MKFEEVLIAEWDSHNREGHECSYDCEKCPSSYRNLGAFLNSRGFPAKEQNTRIFGRFYSEPNFRSKIRSDEFPVKNGPETHKDNARPLEGDSVLPSGTPEVDDELPSAAVVLPKHQLVYYTLNTVRDTVDSMKINMVVSGKETPPHILAVVGRELNRIMESLKHIEDVLSERSELLLQEFNVRMSADRPGEKENTYSQTFDLDARTFVPVPSDHTTKTTRKKQGGSNSRR